ncbi:MAG: ABC transporter ATP-binding protein [Phycisphaerae bacterium]
MVVNVKKNFKLGDTVVQALRGIDLTVRRGTYLSILGPSGSGKSTLFNMIGGLDRPTGGEVFIDEVDIAQLDPYELAWMRCRKIGYIFQSYNILPTLTALENVLLPMIFAGVTQEESQDKAADILTKVGLGDRLFHTPMEMSGGQQQRVAIARAFANSPSLVLADEPTANLDLKTGRQIIHLLRDMNQQYGVTVVSATHDHKMLDVSDRIAWVRDGQIERIEDRSALNIKVGTMTGE